MVMTEEEVRIGLGLPPPAPPTPNAAEDAGGSPLARLGVVPVAVPGRTGRVHMCMCSTVRRRGFQQGDVVDDFLPCLMLMVLPSMVGLFLRVGPSIADVVACAGLEWLLYQVNQGA